MFSLLGSLALLAPLAFAQSSANTSYAPTDAYRLGPSNAACTLQTYNVTVTSNNTVFTNVNSYANETYLTAIWQTFLAAFPYGDNFTEGYTTGYQEVTNTYAIAGTLCTPLSGANTTGVQILLHGIGFDSSYWDFTADGTNTYSYIYSAAAAGHSTFRYDRLGTGLSEKPTDGYNVVQKSTDIAIAAKFAEMLREDGAIAGSPTGGYDKVVMVGHSYGSLTTQGVTVLSPSAVDGALLTGYSANSTAVPLFFAASGFASASAVMPDRYNAAEVSNSYLITVGAWNNQLLYWYFPYYDSALYNYARAFEQPATQGVLLTLGYNITAAPAFTGAVSVITGAYDFPFCQANCYAVPAGSNFTNTLESVQALYPAASSFSTYVVPDAGHVWHLQYSGPAAYQEMIQFAERVFAA